ncbi:MAG: hypothetical protein RBR08_14535 [Desulforegulaceae bacterium]|nr:hypothetical protein [Desulforegulaceae bacterium]
MQTDNIFLHTKLDKNQRKNMIFWFARASDSVQNKILEDAAKLSSEISELEQGEQLLVAFVLSIQKIRDSILNAGKRTKLENLEELEEIDKLRKDQIKAHLRNKNKSLKRSRLLRLSEEIVSMREQEGMKWVEIKMYLEKYKSLKVTSAYLSMNYENLKKSVDLKASQKPSD